MLQRACCLFFIFTLACLPIEIAGRNRLWRYVAMQSIREPSPSV